MSTPNIRFHEIDAFTARLNRVLSTGLLNNSRDPIMTTLRVLSAWAFLGLATQALLATDTSGSRPGTWTYDLAAARALADTTDRPLLVMFSNSSGKCVWCNKFASEIDASDTWNAYASEQQLAMAYIDYNGSNWDRDYYLTFYSTASNTTDVTGFPAFVIYASDGSNVLGNAFSFYGTNITFTAEAFKTKINGILEDNDYEISGEDLWDPADNSAVGATILEFKSFNQRQYHDLNKDETDTADWFKFLCATGKRYLLNVPASDYKIDFTAADSVGSNSTLTVKDVTVGPPVVTNFASTTAAKPVAVTNVLAVVTNFNPVVIAWVTNNLPLTLIVSSVTNDSLSAASTTNGTSSTVSTNLPGRLISFTNGTPPEVISPSFTILDPTRTTALAFETGTTTTNAAPLSSLTNGCVFTATADLNNKYCFVRIEQTISNTPPSFGVVELQQPSTNRTVVTATTNFMDTASVVRTVTNVWASITYTGPTNLVSGSPPPDDFLPAVIIFSNRVTEVLTTTYTNGLMATQSTVTTNTVITGGSNTVTYAYNRTEYKLNYRLWEPGEVGFSSTNVQTAESAASVKLTVTRKNGTAGEIRLRYGFEDAGTPGRDYEAENGKDYKAVEGELFWADGQSGSTNITVDLIQDLRPTWEGDERFAVVLRKHEGATIQAPLNAWSNAVVTLKESAKINAGTLRFAGVGDGAPEAFPNPAKPAAAVTEGEALTLWVERAGGSNGVSRVRVTAVSGSAKSPADFEALSETLDWADGETGAKEVVLQTADREPFNRDATLTVRLAAVLNAKLTGATQVAVTLRDKAVARSLADTAAAAARHGAAFTPTSGDWYWSDEDTLRCASLTKLGQKAALRLTVTGPGVLTFGTEASDGTLGWTGGDDNTLLLKAGRQTVTWTFTRTLPSDVAGESYAALNTLKWYPLQKAYGPEPETGARTLTGQLAWETPSHPAVLLGGDFTVDDADTLDAEVSYTAAAVSPAATPLPDATSPVAFGDLWPALVQPLPGKTYKWRVDTVFSNDAGTLARSGDVWSFTALNPDTSGDTQLPSGGSGDGSYEALQGVFCDFGEIPGEPGSTYAVAVGKLPPGLSLAKATGRMSGVPTQAGTWSFLLQATAPGRIPYATAALTVTVYPLGSFAGTYDGWLTTVAESESCGSATLSLTEKGVLTAKVTQNGSTYSFKKTGLDETDSASDPSAVSGAAFGTTFKATDGRYTNTLAVALNADGTVTGTLTLYALVKNGATTEAVPAEYDVTLYRNNWSEPGLSTVLNAFKGYYTVSLPVTGADDPDNTPWGSGYATLTVGDKGSVKLSGLLADGQSWSASTTLLMPDTNNTSTATVYVYARPSAYAKNGALSGLLRITRAESAYGNTVDGPDSDPTLQWWNRTPTCVYGAAGATASDTTGFRNSLAAAGGFYDTVMNLQTYYLNKALSFTDRTDYPGTAVTERLPADNDGKDGISGYLLLSDDLLLPFGTNIVVGAQTLSASARTLVTNDTDQATSSMLDYVNFDESGNVAGLTLSLTRATGLFSGSFNLVYERENANGAFVRRTRKVSHKGVHTPVRPDRTTDDPSEGVQGAGFYLIPDTGSYLDSTGRAKTYSFNWSFAFELFSEQR
jgi:hypothetical protein